jgi:hypothetical protein
MFAPALFRRLRFWRTAPPASRRRSARSAVVAGFVVAAVAQLSLTLAVETRKPHWRDPEFGHRQKQFVPLAKWAATVHRPVVVVLGSSRVELGLSPDHLGFTGPTDPVVYNFSQSGCGPAGQLLNLTRLLDAGVKVDAVVVELLRPLLGEAGTVEMQFKGFPERYTVADHRRLADHWANPWPARGQWVTSRAAAWYTYRLSLLQHAGRADWLPASVRTDYVWTQLRPTGWMPYYPGDMPAAERAARVTAAWVWYSKLLNELELSPAVDRLYRDLVRRCRDRGIRVAFLVMPESAEFRSWYPPDVLAATTGYTRELSRTCGAPLFDCSEWVSDELAFYDAHHLAGPAAEAFSQRFGRECLEPWLK